MKGDNCTNLENEINTNELRMVRFELNLQGWDEFGEGGRENGINKRYLRTIEQIQEILNYIPL